MVHQTRSGRPGSLYKSKYDDASVIDQDSTLQGSVAASKYKDKYQSDQVSLSENSSSVLDYESFRSKLRSVTSSFSGVKGPFTMSTNETKNATGKVLDSRDTSETESQNSDWQRNPAEDDPWDRSPNQNKIVSRNVYSDETMEIHFRRSDNPGPSMSQSLHSSMEDILASFGKGSVDKGEKIGYGSVTKDSCSSFVSSNHFSAAPSSSIDSSNRSDEICRAPTRSKNEKARGILEVARGMFRARTKKASDSVRGSSEKRKPSSMSSSQLRRAVKLKLLMKAKQEEEHAIQHAPRKESVSPSVRGGMSRGQKTPRKKAFQRGRTKSIGTRQPATRLPWTQLKLSKKAEQSKKGKAHGNKNANNYQTKKTEVNYDDSGDRSLLDSIYDAFGNWSRHESQDRMAAYENSRLGDSAVSNGTTRRRLEIAPEKTDQQEDLSQSASALDEESVENEFEDSETKADMTIVASVAEAWDEIIESAAVIARHYEVDWRGESESIRMKEGEDFREAMKIFREHAKRLNIDPNDLFAAVREDASIHENSTSDDDETIDYLGDLFAGLRPGVDAGLDRYVDAVDGMLDGFRCGSRDDASTISSIPASTVSKSQQKLATTANKFQASASSRLSL